MEYKVEDVSPVKKKIKVSVDQEEADAAITTTVALYRSSTDIKGFRKGKAPGDLIESKFRKQIYQEATQDLINYQLNEIMSELKLEPLSKLDVDAGELARGESFEYTVSFEVLPEFELPEYNGLVVEQEEPQVVESEVDSVIERIRDNTAELQKVEEKRQPEDGEVATINFTAFENGEPFGDIKADNFDLPLGEGQALPEFEEIVKGLKPDESGEGDVNFPEDFINADLAGRTLAMKIELKGIKKRVRPEVDEELAQKAGGFESVEQMREAIRNSYLETRKTLAKSQAQKKLLDQLLEKVDFALPESMVEENIDNMVADYKRKLEEQGRSLESTGKSGPEIRDSFREEAERLVKSQVLLLGVAKREGIEVQREEVHEYLRQSAIRNNQDFEAVLRFYEDNNLMFALRDKLAADKAIDLIYANAEIKEVPAESAMIGGEAAERSSEAPKEAEEKTE
jgi:trigger factor